MRIRCQLARALAVAVIATAFPGCAWLGVARDLAEQEASFRNDGVRANLRTVGLALLVYARDHQGVFPADDRWMADLSRSYYLPGQRLPDNPFSLMGEWGQANAPALGPLPPLEGEAFMPPAPGTVLGKGSRPTGSAYTTTTYGAILYDAAPDRRRCVLYGVGQQGDDAVLVDSHMRGSL
ncbi:MAG: hypothetical protein VKS61_01070 [Candidatus Sericytochromatia bacterium]|nr:hypothetical protein [Candidatus Sericytochromatia bacterium]